MELKEIDKPEAENWNDFLLQNAPEVFLQSREWGDFQKLVGHYPRYFIFTSERDETFAQVLILEHRLPLGLKYWYVPRGPILKKAIGLESTDAMLQGLEKEAKKAGALFVRWDEGKPQDVWQTLLSQKARALPFSVQPPDTWLLDLNQTEEELLAAMKPKTRYNLRLSGKKGVQVAVAKINDENLCAFWQLMEATADRAGIQAHAQHYYSLMLKNLSLEGKEKLFARLYFARAEGEVLAANITLFFGDTVTYLHGASSDKRRSFMAPYTLQWRQILDAKSWGAKHYDFWGIDFQNKNPQWAGFTRFKQGFGGEVVSYASVYDLPVRRRLYEIYKLLKKINKIPAR